MGDLYKAICHRTLGYGTDLIPNMILKMMKSLGISNACNAEKFHTSRINCIDIDMNGGKFLISVSESGEIGIYNIGDNNIRLNNDRVPYNYSKFVIPIISKIYGNYGIQTVQWYPIDTGIFITSSYSKGLSVWDTNRSTIVENFPFENPIYHHHMSIVPQVNPLIAVATSKIHLVDLLVGSHIHTLPTQNLGNYRLVKWSNMDQNLLATVQNFNLALWDIRKFNSHLYSIDIPGNNFRNKYSPALIQGMEYCDNHLALYINNGPLLVYNLSNIAKDPMVLNHYQRPPYSLPFVPNEGREWVTKFAYDPNLIYLPHENRIRMIYTTSLKCNQTMDIEALHFGDITNCIAHPTKAGYLYTSALDASIIEWSIYNRTYGDRD